MNQNEIMAMVREAGGYESPQYPENLVMDEHDLSRFAALVAAKEREACARLVQDKQDLDPYAGINGWAVADSIRTRGQKEGV